MNITNPEQRQAEVVWPVVTVNILTFNRRDELRVSLTKLLHELDYPKDRLEIIVVDNASNDGTKEMVMNEFAGVQLIENRENCGISGWNKGFEAGQGDYFLVLDDDCYISESSLKIAIKNAQDHNADLVSFLVRSPYHRDFSFNADYNMGLLAFWGCSVLISRHAIQKLAGFDRNIFIWAHELEFTIRLLDHGLKHLYLPEVTSYHMKELVAGDRLADVFSFKTNIRNFAYIAAKLFRPYDATVSLINLIVRATLTLVRRPATRGALPAVVEGFWSGLKNRAPVRSNISAVYRRNYIEFVSPFLFIRNPKRREDFYRGRPRWYPDHTSLLEL